MASAAAQHTTQEIGNHQHSDVPSSSSSYAGISTGPSLEEDETTSLLHHQQFGTYHVFDDNQQKNLQEQGHQRAVVTLGEDEGGAALDATEMEEAEEEEEGRTIYVNDRGRNAQFQYPSNKTTTTKYTWWNFLFKNLYEQVSRNIPQPTNCGL